jgi:teichuronic acid biosynthesis glycosyltransferase TuaG
MNASVSVILPHYNAIGTIKRSIDSVVNQTLSVGEIVIVDDGSSSVEELKLLIASYENIVPIVFITVTVNQGAAHARNVGIQNSQFKYLAFLDSDDVWHPEKIKTQYSLMETRDIFLSGHGYLYNLGNEKFETEICGTFVSISEKKFIWGNPFFTPTVMARRHGFIPFDERFRRIDDYKCWFENLSNGPFVRLSANLAGGFKAPIGVSGLSGSLKLMHSAYLTVLRSLFKEKKMSFKSYILATSLETVKYPIRLVAFKLKADR